MDREQEFLQAFDDYADQLFRHCFFRVSDRERALELVQDAFMKSWEYLSRGEEVRQFRPFLYRVLNNLIIDEYRKKKDVSLDAMLEQNDMSLDQIDELGEGSFDDAVARLDAKLLQEKLSALPQPYQESVTLRYVDGLSPKEIASYLEESENVVSVRIHRGLKMLRKAFDHA